MENRINIAQLLKDCPKGMELYSPIFGNVKLEKVFNNFIYVFDSDELIATFDKKGKYKGIENGECQLFPSKDQRDWSKFQGPFKDGDVVIGNNICCSYIAIYKKFRDKSSFYCHAVYNSFGKFRTNDYSDKSNLRLATEEEKQKLFDAIKANGYKWNAETKTLEELVKPKFKVGDRVKHISAYTSGIIVKVDDKGYHIDYPKGEGVCYISFTLEKDYELAPNKFDITTLKPFDKVLVRDGDTYVWEAHLFSRYYKNSDKPYICIGVEVLNEYRRG